MIGMCKIVSNLHESIRMPANFGRDANLVLKFRLERARVGVITITAGAMVKAQNSVGLKE